MFAKIKVGSVIIIIIWVFFIAKRGYDANPVGT